MSKFNLRKHRGKQQKLYFIDSNNIDDYRKEFNVMGSTGNVYTVSISNETSCTCPDYKQRHARCKHVFFILLRIMNVNENDVDQNKYSNAEIKDMFDNMPGIIEELKIGNTLKNKYNQKTPKNTKVKLLGMDDLCPICLEDMNNGEEYDYCQYYCGRAVHINCFDMCKGQNGNNCVFCRNPFNQKQNNE